MTHDPRSILVRASSSLVASVLALTGVAACSAANTGAASDGGTLLDGAASADGATPPDGGVTADGGSPEASPPDASSADGSATTSGDAASGGDSAPTGEGGAGAVSCSSGTLVAGNPVYGGQPTDRPASGTGVLADPPLPWLNLVLDGARVYTQDGQSEVWTTDLSATKPVETLVAGLNEPSGALPFNDGACAAARFDLLHGVALLPDHSLVVSDFAANAVLHIKDPAGSTCAVEYWAGNRTPSADENTDTPPSGDADGPGATALFNGPSALATDAAGNTYVFDTANHKLKKIGADAQHTVKTLATLPADGPSSLSNLVTLGSMVYGVGVGATDGFILGFDSTSGAMTTVKQGDASVFTPVPAGHVPVLAGLATDGHGLIVAGSGYLWYVTLAGDVTLLAGTGTTIDFPPTGYDPKATQPAASLVLEENQGDANSGSLDFIAYGAGAVYFRGHGDGTSYFIEKIACP